MTGFTPFTGPDPVPENTPSFTLEHHIASLRDGDPEKWARLNAEWVEKSLRGVM